MYVYRHISLDSSDILPSFFIFEVSRTQIFTSVSFNFTDIDSGMKFFTDKFSISIYFGSSYFINEKFRIN
jgi:hypothetical protein